MKSYEINNFKILVSDSFRFFEKENKIIFSKDDNYISKSQIVIYKDKNVCELSVDLVRTYPIFYFWKDGKWFITDKLSVNDYKNWKIDNFSKQEFLLTGYVTGENTLLKDIYQVEAGTKVYLYEDGKKDIDRYFLYATKKEDLLKEPYQNLQIKFSDLLYEVFSEMIKSLENKTVVIPLSGGYDSRLVVTMLKELGYQNVICFTYGKPDSFEVLISKKLADRLGYKWYFVEYTNELYSEVIKSGLFDVYLDFSFNYTSLPHIQDLFAVYFLKEKKLIPKESIFIPGHSGDFFAGTHIYNVGRIADKEKVAEEIYYHHYILSENHKNKKNFINKILNNLKDGEPWTVMECWDLENRQAKFIVNSLRVYEFFGYESRIPLWHPKLVNFFKKVDYDYKNRNHDYSLENNLYDSVAMKIFSKYGVDIKKNISNKRALTSKVKKILRRNSFIYNIYNFVREVYYKFNGDPDINNFREICNILEINYKFNINSSLVEYLIKKFDIR
jgi:asparagine synthase (glutamine-hydrolysing)